MSSRRIKRYEVIVMPQAERDLRDIDAYIAADSKRAADRFLRQLVEHCDSLSAFPHRFPAAREDRTRKLGIRQSMCGSYRILFIIRATNVFVLRIGHGARQSIVPDPGVDRA